MRSFIISTLLLLALILSATATAHDFEVDGVYYNTNGNEAAVTFRGRYCNSFYNEYSGSVVIPATVTYNGTTYPVTSIDTLAFYSCSEMTSIDLPNSIIEIGPEAFSYCPGLTGIVIESGNPRYDSRDNCNAIIETASNTLIIGCKNTTIPNSVTAIGQLAFEGCSSLTNIDIPNSVTAIGHFAFCACEGLTSIDIPNSVTEIGVGVFDWCTGLASIVVESGNPRYDSRNNCYAIIETAFNELIYGCKNTTIPNSVTAIGDYAFDTCHGLTSIDIPNSVTKIGEGAFYSCVGLTSINRGNSVTSIGDWAFADCYSLTSIDLPNSVTEIGEGAFFYCYYLTSIVIPNSVTSIGNEAFKNCRRLPSVHIPNSVTAIGVETFSGCAGLTSIVIPNSVTAIGDSAFYKCAGLTSIVIPNSVIEIGEGAFCYCSRLTDVYCYIADLSRVSSGNELFYLDNGDYSGRTLHVLQGTADAYRADENWYTYFGRIVEDIFIGDVNRDLEVNIADVNAAIDIILGGNDDTTAADVNGDGEINIADINALIDIILSGTQN